MILVIDTHAEEARLALDIDGKVFEESWKAGRELSATILMKLDDLYQKAGKKIAETDSLIVNLGPGSFTSLRIGISIANTIAYALDLPVVGVSKESDLEKLISTGKKLLEGKKKFRKPVIPVYGSEPNITKPKER